MPLDQIGEEKEMSFLDHLEELRWHIIRAVVAILLFTILAMVFKDVVVGVILMGPSKTDFWTYVQMCELGQLLGSDGFCIDSLNFEIQSRKVQGQFMSFLSISLATGLVLGFPYAFWEIWRFVRPGLYAKERKASRGATFSITFLLFIGISFGYFVITPIALYFFSDFQLYEGIRNEWDISSYLSVVTLIVFGAGILFQLPVIVYFLTKAGLIGSAFLRKYRKHALIIILIVGAIITPPDPISQILIAVPLLGLYQVSIGIARRIERREARKSL